MTTIPIQLKSGRVLIIGKGYGASAKANLFTQLGCQVTRWREHPGIGLLKEESAAQKSSRRFALVVIAGNNSFTEEMANWAKQHNLLCNHVDQPEKSDIYIPAIVQRGVVRIGIGTGGVNPVLARLVRSAIELALPTSLGQLAQICERWNKKIRKALPDMRIRKRFWESILTGTLASEITKGDRADSDSQDAIVNQKLNEALADNSKLHKGEVYLVGGGPGDPELLTIKAVRAMQQADVILHDSLITPQILELARRDAQRIDVGKRHSNENAKTQQQIYELMVELAQQGKLVCRLKGGDPLMFARGGEEMEHLAQAGIPYEIIPGISSANGIAAACGIPLTHRKLSHNVRFITGHKVMEQWQNLQLQEETLVVYMGFRQIVKLTQALLASGVTPGLPIAFIQNGTCPNQRTVITNLGKAAQVQQEFDLSQGPILLIIGKVAGLAKKPESVKHLNKISADWISPQKNSHQEKVITYAL